MSLKDSFAAAKQPALTPVLDIILCDVHGTLVGPDNHDLVAYLNHCHGEHLRKAGPQVVIASGNMADAPKDIAHLGLHPDLIAGLKDKQKFVFQTVAVMIDDEPTVGLFAEITLNPQDPQFRDFLKAELARGLGRGPQPTGP